MPKNNVDNKNKKFNKLSVVIIVMLAVILIMLFFGLAGLWLSSASYSAGGFVVGDHTSLQLVENGASVCSFNFSTTALPGDKYKQNLSVFSSATFAKSFVRAKVVVKDALGNEESVEIEQSEAWIKSDEDNYFYYNDCFISSQTADFLTALKLPAKDALGGFYAHTLQVVVEAIPAEAQLLDKLWKTAPSLDFIT